MLLHVSCAECSMMPPLAGWDGCVLLACLQEKSSPCQLQTSRKVPSQQWCARVTAAGGAERVPARPIADFYPPREARPVCFLKVPSPRHQYPDRNLDL
eukprot:COSAG01_NODE_20709_length_939_cov_1.045238_1_plen_97_part_10